MKKIVLTVATISVASTTYTSTVAAPSQDSRPLQIELSGAIGCPFPSPIPSLPPPPPKVLSGQAIEIFYRPIACDSTGVVPIKLTFDLFRQTTLETIVNVLPPIELVPPKLTPPPTPNATTPTPSPSPSPLPTPSPPAPTPPVFFGSTAVRQFFSPSAGIVTLQGTGRQFICMRVSFVQNPPPIIPGATYGECATYEVVALPAPVPLNPWIPAALALIVLGVRLQWSSKRGFT
jgi:hypothetical protein